MSGDDLLFTQIEVYQLCTNNGWGPKAAKIASAIAMCEAPLMRDGIAHSNFGAVGDQSLANLTWGYSYGGFQVRSLRADKGTGNIRDEDQLVRPRFNVRSALAIKQAMGFSAWSTYNADMHLAYLQVPLFDGDPVVVPPEQGTYIVVAGDTLSGIADKLGGFTWQDLARVNGLHSPYSLTVGQKLVLPDPATVAAQRSGQWQSEAVAEDETE